MEFFSDVQGKLANEILGYMRSASDKIEDSPFSGNAKEFVQVEGNVVPRRDVEEVRSGVWRVVTGEMARDRIADRAGELAQRAARTAVNNDIDDPDYVMNQVSSGLKIDQTGRKLLLATANLWNPPGAEFEGRPVTRLLVYRYSDGPDQTLASLTLTVDQLDQLITHASIFYPTDGMTYETTDHGEAWALTRVFFAPENNPLTLIEEVGALGWGEYVAKAVADKLRDVEEEVSVS